MKFFHDKIVDNEILYSYTNLNKNYIYINNKDVKGSDLASFLFTREFLWNSLVNKRHYVSIVRSARRLREAKLLF